MVGRRRARRERELISPNFAKEQLKPPSESLSPLKKTEEDLQKVRAMKLWKLKRSKTQFQLLVASTSKKLLPPLDAPSQRTISTSSKSSARSSILSTPRKWAAKTSVKRPRSTGLRVFQRCRSQRTMTTSMIEMLVE